MRFHHAFLASLLLPLVGCGPSHEFSQSSSDDELAKRAHEIHDEIVAKLKLSNPLGEDSLWSSTKVQMQPDWIVQGPDRIWGATADQIPDSLDCDLRSPDCDKDFKRQHCTLDRDCQTVSTQCVPLLASITKLGQSPTKMCLGMGDSLMDRFYSVLTSADHELDFVSLSMPSGRFYTVMINALAFLSQKDSVPSIRLLFSGNVAGLPGLNSTSSIMKKITDSMKSTAPQTYHRLHMNLAWLGKDASWNHAKIIVADGNRALQGGHNFWDAQYLSARTIFDLSMEYRGEGAAAARNFVNSLWNAVDQKYFSSYPADLGRMANFSGSASDTGDVEIITVGRLGTFGDNVSEKGIQYLIDSATTSIALIQQDLYNFFILPLPLFRTFAFDNIVNAAARGVHVKMILSNQHAYNGYSTINGPVEYKTFLDALVQKFRVDQGMSKEAAEKTACERIVTAPFRFSRSIGFWPGKKDEQPGLHTKFLMVDDAAFYLGSHNLYPANLQEFGNIVTDAPVTAQIRSQYWDRVWNESESVVMACPY